MAIKSEWVRYGDEIGFLARPELAQAPLPGVLVIQEVMGVNEHIEEVTRRIAAAGYVALAPDLFAVKGERPAALSRERIAKAMSFLFRRQISESMGQISGPAVFGRMEGMTHQLRSAVRYLRSERAETRMQRVGCVGFCMGGGLSALLACEEPELAAAAVYYGTAPSPEKVARINCPIIAFYGERDQRVNAGIPGFEEGMRKAGKSFEYHVYPGAAHAFFNDDGRAYEVRAARDSFARLLTFFAKNLSG
jgi:carboxymethylenebutenolidase